MGLNYDSQRLDYDCTTRLNPMDMMHKIPGFVVPGITKTVFGPVDRPAHYIEGRKFEPRDVMYDWKLPVGPATALKYISRLGRKPNGKSKVEAVVEDCSKAINYLNDYMDRVKSGEVEV